MSDAKEADPLGISRCDICDRTFEIRKKYYEHVAYHKRKLARKTVKCKNCTVKFSTEIELQEHVKKHHKIKCNLCDSRFPQQWFLTYHLIYVHPKENPFMCYICGQDNSSEDDVKNHLKQHDIKRIRLEGDSMKYLASYKCMLCPKEMRGTRLRNHIMSVHLGLSPSVIANTDKPSFHRKEIALEQAFKCQECGIGFPRKHELKDHLSETGHSSKTTMFARPEKPSKKLDRTKENASSEEESSEEHEVEDLENDGRLNCSECTQSFRNETSLEAHRWKHVIARQNEDSFFERLRECRERRLREQKLKEDEEKSEVRE